MGMAGGAFRISVGFTSYFRRYFTNRRYIKGFAEGEFDGVQVSDITTLEQARFIAPFPA
jgi:hypothetical protein